MLETIKNAIAVLHGMNVFIEVIILSAGLYYICRWHLDWGPKKSQWVPIVTSFVGIFGYVWPANAQDVIKILVLGGMHAAVAMGTYSFAEKRGWVDRVGDAIENRFFPPKKDDGAKP